MGFELLVGEPHQEPALQHGVDDGGLRVDVSAIAQIDLVDDFSHEVQARLLRARKRRPWFQTYTGCLDD